MDSKLTRREERGEPDSAGSFFFLLPMMDCPFYMMLLERIQPDVPRPVLISTYGPQCATFRFYAWISIPAGEGEEHVFRSTGS